LTGGVDVPRERAPVDPRIRARRRGVARAAARRRLRRVVAGLAVAAVVTLGVLLVRSPLLDVDRIAVHGADRTGAAAVAAATGVSPGDRLVGVPLGEVADRVGRLPWVASVEVSRTWPGTLRVRVVERVPVAAVPAVAAQGGAPAGWVLVDAAGHQLQVVPDPGGLPRLEPAGVVPEPGRGLPGDGDWKALLAVAASIPERAVGAVVALRPDGAGGVDGTVRLPDGTPAQLHLGDAGRLPTKWLAVLSLYESVDLRGAAVIDVRVPHAPVVRRR
jgi:cell division protein FtsQ